MRYIGIDYGSKRVGIAVSDEAASFALPEKVIQNTKKLFEELNEIVCKYEHIEAFILGESKNFKGEDNLIMEKVREFKTELETRFGKPVLYEPEFMTSQAAERFQGKNEFHDASAAALILQSYLDRLKNSSNVVEA